MWFFGVQEIKQCKLQTLRNSLVLNTKLNVLEQHLVVTKARKKKKKTFYNDSDYNNSFNVTYHHIMTERPDSDRSLNINTNDMNDPTQQQEDYIIYNYYNQRFCHFNKVGDAEMNFFIDPQYVKKTTTICY